MLIAHIIANPNSAMHQIRSWRGLNECPDGDAGMQAGEAAEMRNWRVTADGHLQLRPGTKTLCRPAEGRPVRGLWSGVAGGGRLTVCAAGGMLYRLTLDAAAPACTPLGPLADAETHFFAFDDRLYMLNGQEYKVWDGETLREVEGYRPLVAVTVPPAGGGVALERVNLLNGLRRCRLSPDGVNNTFQLPETGLLRLDYCRDLRDGMDIPFQCDLEEGVISFIAPPPEGTDSIEVGWSVAPSQRGQVTAMRFSELYNGATDSRVFLYGDGSSRTLYSGLTHEGRPTAEYFPDMNWLDAGESNTPITGMIRHFSRLLVFKTGSAWCVQYGAITLADSSVTAGFFLTPVNRAVGHEAVGQVCLVRNDPRTLCAGAVYEWRSAGGYLTLDERNATRISERVDHTLSQLRFEDARVFDDNVEQQMYILCGDRALVHNYGRDAWFLYEHFPVAYLLRLGGGLYGATRDGRIVHISREYRSDDGEVIHAVWRSGSMGFQKEWLRKYATLVFLNVEPELASRVEVSARTDRGANYPIKVVASSFANFLHVDFRHFSFNTNSRPRIRRVRLKVKKFALYQLLLESHSSSTTATVLSVDIRTRYTGNTK